MIRVALTGGIACGKSLVGAYLSEVAVPVCDADQLARQALEPGQEAYDRVIQEFGRDVVLADGTLDRRELGRRVFQDPAQRARLNALVHPWVRRAWTAWLDEQAAAGADCAVVIIPLLYEIGDEASWDAVICVTCPRRAQMERLRSRGLSEEEARQRLQAQMDPQRKAEQADYVIVNSGGTAMLKRQTLSVLASIRRR